MVSSGKNDNFWSSVFSHLISSLILIANEWSPAAKMTIFCKFPGVVSQIDKQIVIGLFFYFCFIRRRSIFNSKTNWSFFVDSEKITVENSSFLQEIVHLHKETK